MIITRINRQVCRRLADVMETTLNEMEIEGIAIKVGNATFCSDNATFKIEVAVKSDDGDDGVVKTREASDWPIYASGYGLPRDGIGKVISISGEKLEIVGIKPKSKKFPILCKRLSDGKIYKYPVRVIKEAL